MAFSIEECYHQQLKRETPTVLPCIELKNQLKQEIYERYERLYASNAALREMILLAVRAGLQSCCLFDEKIGIDDTLSLADLREVFLHVKSLVEHHVTGFRHILEYSSILVRDEEHPPLLQLQYLLVWREPAL